MVYTNVKSMNRVKTMTVIFTLHVGLQINVQVLDELRADCCRLLASCLRGFSKHTRTHNNTSEGFGDSYLILSNINLFPYSHLEHLLYLKLAADTQQSNTNTRSLFVLIVCTRNSTEP
jgi:hypothetical protein